MKYIELKTGVWDENKLIRLGFPETWDVITYWPKTPKPLDKEEIKKRIDSPVGQPPLEKIAIETKRPCIIIDDLTRPTPIYKVLPFILEKLQLANIDLDVIRIIVATGTHGEQDLTRLAKKIGNDIMQKCQVIVHNDKKNLVHIGKTSFNTPVYVNKEAINSDLLIGIGGVYPQHTTGFGGGSKLALGVLGRQSISHLHFSHEGVDGSYNINNSFRKDVTEIARMIKLNTMFSIHINEHQEIVNLICGDHFLYYPEAANFSKENYTAPAPNAADVVIANAYPLDTSYLFMRKAYKPLDLGPKRSTKIIISSNYEGIGKHGLFQHMKPSRFAKITKMYQRIASLPPNEILHKLKNKIKTRNISTTKEQTNYALPKDTRRLYLYKTSRSANISESVDGISIVHKWDDILKIIDEEHNSNNRIKVRIYPCSPIQCIDT